MNTNFPKTSFLALYYVWFPYSNCPHNTTLYKEWLRVLSKWYFPKCFIFHLHIESRSFLLFSFLAMYLNIEAMSSKLLTKIEQVSANILPFCLDSCRCPCRRPLLYDPLTLCECSILENSAFMPAIFPTLPALHSRHISPLYNVVFSFLPPSLITTHTHLRFSSLYVNCNKRKSFWSAENISLI